jgi:hypothetical protein
MGTDMLCRCPSGRDSLEALPPLTNRSGATEDLTEPLARRKLTRRDHIFTDTVAASYTAPLPGCGVHVRRRVVKGLQTLTDDETKVTQRGHCFSSFSLGSELVYYHDIDSKSISA